MRLPRLTRDGDALGAIHEPFHPDPPIVESLMQRRTTRGSANKR